VKLKKRLFSRRKRTKHLATRLATQRPRSSNATEILARKARNEKKFGHLPQEVVEPDFSADWVERKILFKTLVLKLSELALNETRSHLCCSCCFHNNHLKPAIILQNWQTLHKTDNPLHKTDN